MTVETLRKAAETIRDEDPCRTYGCPWHGPVALAVADWLDEQAAQLDDPSAYWLSKSYARRNERALAVARAYLGENL